MPTVTWIGHLVQQLEKPLTDYCIQIGNSILSWKTKKVLSQDHQLKQFALASTTSEITWMFGLSKDLDGSYKMVPVPLFYDNKASLIFQTILRTMTEKNI